MLKLELQRFGAPGLTSPVRTEAFKNLQLNAGVLLINLDYSSIADANALKTAITTNIHDPDKCLGVTRNGGKFTATKSSRTPDVDGMRYPFMLSDFVDFIDGFLSGTLLEVIPGNVKRLLGTADVSISGKKTTITVHTAPQESDYIQHLAWAGDIADGRMVLIELDNAFNTSDFNLTFKDKSEGEMTFEFHARQDDVGDYDEAPFRVVFFEPSGDMGILTVSSAAGTSVGNTAITTTNTLGAGEHYVYKVGDASNAPTIGYREQPDYTWTEWDGTSQINVGASANGYKATFAVVNSGGRAVKSGSVTLAVKTA